MTDRRWPRKLAIEAGGFAFAFALASIALAHVLGTARGVFVLSSGDSVFLEFVWRALRDGTDHQWSMSAVLFVFPELPLYFALRLLADLPQQATIANALLSAMLLYALLRAVVGLLRPPRYSVIIAVVSFGFLAACILTEGSSAYESFELTSFFFAGTFYYGTLLALFAGLFLVAVLVRHPHSLRDPRMVSAASALALGSALCTMSNPLYLVWVAAPLCVAIAVVAIRTTVTWSRGVAIVAIVVGASGIGMLLRLPLSRFASPVAQPYVHLDRSFDSLVYYAFQVSNLLKTPTGRIEFILFAALCAAAVLAFVLAIRRRSGPVVLLVASTGFAAPIIVLLFNVVLGTESVRYLQPLYFAPLLSIVVLGSLAASRPSPRLRRAPAWVVPTAAAASVIAIVVGSVPSIGILHSIATTPYARVQCLEEWLDGRALVGAGWFWQSRDLEAFGDESVEVLQVEPDFHTHPWMVDLTRYYDADVSYLVSTDAWTPDVERLLGAPAEVVECGSYTILDYAGTPGQVELRSTINDTAKFYAQEQGLR